MYDRTGSLEDSEEDLNALYEYYQAELTEEDIINFKVNRVTEASLSGGS